MQTMADCKAQYQCRSQGLEESEWRVASNLSYLRRQLSVCAVRSVADSLFSRLQQAGVGPGRGARLATLHKELSDTRRRRIKIALQKEATREVLEGGEALEGWLPD